MIKRTSPDGGSPRALLSVVVPCFDEEAVIRETHRRLVATLETVPDLDFELVYVDDGSRDATLDLLRELQNADARVRVIALSRNFGHQIAITAGLKCADGDAVAVIDADLQDPPEVIPEMLERWRAGADAAYGLRWAQAVARHGAHLAEALRLARAPRSMLALLGLSAAAWACEGAVFATVAAAIRAGAAG